MSSSTWPEVGNQLKELRVKAGRSQGDIARATGISQAAVSRIELGQRETSWDVICAWAESCGTEVHLILGASAISARVAPIVTLLEQQPDEILRLIEGVLRAFASARAGDETTRRPA